MIGALKRLKQVGNRHAGKLFLIGLAGVVWYNWRSWQRDKALLARQPKPEPLPALDDWPQAPLVSVLVAAWNEADMIERHIEQFLSLRYPHKELILCAGGEDGTYGLACHHAAEQVIVLEQQLGEGKQGALNRCLAAARGDVVFLTDADSLLDDESFLHTLDPVARGQEIVATGLSRPLAEQLNQLFVIHQWCADTYAAAAHRQTYVSGIKGTNCALRRSALEALGGFEAEVRTGTDYHLAKQLVRHGYRIRHVPGSVNQTASSETFAVHARRQSRWLRNLVVHGRRFNARAEVATALRTSFVGLGMLLLPPVLFPFWGFITLSGWALALVHGMLCKVRYFAFTQARHQVALNRRYLLWIPLYTLGDFVIWSWPLLDLILDRERW